jgi:gliding motility-associated-like protein
MILKRLLFILALIALSANSFANHILGGNITWECLGGDQYEITFTMYKDCYGTPGDPPTESFYFFPSGCGQLPFSVDLDYVSAVEISDLCATELASSSCVGGLAPGTMQVTYSGTVTLAAGCTWEAIWNNGSWNYFQNMDNFIAGNPVDAYIQTSINTNIPCANSVDITSSFAAPAIEYACQNLAFTHQINVANPGGYTLAYSILPSQTTGATIDATVGIPGYSAPAGLILTPNAAGALLDWATPGPDLGSYAFVLQITMTSGGNTIGVIYENMTIVVRNCVPTITTFAVPNVTSVGNETNLVNGTTVEACAGDSLQFTVEANNADITKSITLTWAVNAPDIDPGFVFVQNASDINPAIGTFTLLTTGAMTTASPYVLTITATDNACPTPDTDVIQITVHVRPNIELNVTDTTICLGQSVTAIASGINGNNYQWSVLSGDATSGLGGTTPNQTLTPDVTTVYRVTAAGIPPQCNVSDTLTVHVALTAVNVVSSAETCSAVNGSVTANATGDGSGTYLYDWNIDPNGAAADPQTITGLNGGPTVYNVIVTDAVYGCSITSANATVADVPAPVVTFTGGTTICAGGSTCLTITLTSGSAPFDVTWTDPPVTTDDGPNNDWTDLGDDVPSVLTHIFCVTPGISDTCTLATVTDASGCTANIVNTQTVTVRPLVTASFLPEPALCVGGNVVLDVDISQAGNYVVTYSSCAPLTGGSVTVADNGTINVPDPTVCGTCAYDIESVEYTNAPACPSSDAANPPLNVTLNCLPTATVAGGDTVCTGACQNIIFTCTGVGPWTVNYTRNGIAQVALNIVTSPFSFNVCPTSNATYCITSVIDANCTNSNNSNLNSCTTVTVAQYPTLLTYTASDTELCPGESVTLNATFSPALGVTLVFQQNPGTNLDVTFSGQNNPFSYIDSPLTTQTYTLEKIYLDASPQCSTIVNNSITVNMNTLIAVQAMDTICNTAITPYTFQVQYDISGGEVPYVEAPLGSPGAFTDANSYLTGAISGSPSAPGSGSWTFSDLNDCNQVTMSVTNYFCSIVTDAGSMANTPIQVCGPVAVGGTYNNNMVLDANDELMWILTTTDGPAPYTVLASNATSASFNFIDGTTVYGTTYYIVAVAGDAAAGGLVNLNTPAPYIDYSNGQPVTWYEVPTATLSAPNGLEACQGSCVTMSVALTGTGPWVLTYDVQGGSNTTVTVPAGGSPYTFQVCSSVQVSLVSVTSGGALNTLCNGTLAGGPLAIQINPLPTATISGNASVCQGLSHNFVVTFLTGESPWDFEIDDPVGANDSVNNVTSPYNYPATANGTYDIVSVTDNNGCTNIADIPSATLTVNALPSVTWVGNTASFCAGSCVDIILDIIGPPAGLFTPDFTNPAPGLVETPVADGATYSVCVAGTYTINSVTDVNGCVSAIPDDIIVSSIALPTADAGADMEQCVDGDVTIGTPAAGGVTYAWTADPASQIVGSSTIAQPTVNSAAAGNTIYTVTATTVVGGCTATDAALVTYYALPTISITANPDSLCATDCTTLTASGADDYVWTAGDGTLAPYNTASLVACPSASATYTVTGTENYATVSCSATQTADVIVGAPLAFVSDYTEEVCFGTCNGEISLTPSGGFAPYTVSGDLTQLSTNDLCPGTYNFTIEDNIGCSIAGSLTIDERLPETIDDIQVTNATCAYDLGTVTVTDGTTSINITGINGCDTTATIFSNTAVFDNLLPCEYQICTVFSVLDENGSIIDVCSTCDTVEVIIISSEVNFNPVWTEDTFCYLDEVCFTSAAAGGTGGLVIRWYDNPELVAPSVSSDNPYCIFIEEAQTLYGVAQDQLGCYSDTVMVVANMFPDITLSTQNGADTVFICEYDCAQLFCTASGGNGNVQTEWYEIPPAPLDDVLISTNNTTEVCPFVDRCYYVIASDGCSVPKTDTVCVHVWDTPEVLIDNDISEGCFPLTVQLVNLSQPIADAVTCLWNLDNGFALPTCDAVVVDFTTNMLVQNFYPSLTITTEHGCVGSDTLDDPIIVYGYPEIDFTWDPQPVTVLEHNVQFTNLSQGAVSYNWNFFGGTTSQAVNPQFNFPDFDMGVFQVCLSAVSSEGCADTLCQDIIIESILQVYVPNTFTPDGDGINDVFQPIVTGYKENTYRFWIFNRWGDPIFYTEDPEMAWTGGADGGEYYVNSDTFVWRLEVEALRDGKIEVSDGTVTLLR